MSNEPHALHVARTPDFAAHLALRRVRGSACARDRACRSASAWTGPPWTATRPMSLPASKLS